MYFCCIEGDPICLRRPPYVWIEPHMFEKMTHRFPICCAPGSISSPYVEKRPICCKPGPHMWPICSPYVAHRFRLQWWKNPKDKARRAYLTSTCQERLKTTGAEDIFYVSSWVAKNYFQNWSQTTQYFRWSKDPLVPAFAVNKKKSTKKNNAVYTAREDQHLTHP